MKILLVGAGGYGSGYVHSLLNPARENIVFEGVVEPYFETCSTRSIIENAGIPVYATMEEFYARHSADLAIISTPPFLHKAQSLCALQNGSYVLCEKPVAPTPQDVSCMLQAEKQYDRWIAVGYQWSFSEAVQALKKDILAGVLGKPVALKTAISWPRSRGYYARGGGWGGAVSKNGVMVLDSIASNACAHYLHNMLFVLGEDMLSSAQPQQLQATCYRANAIENFDTCSIQCTAAGASVYFVASHAAGKNRNPEFEYTFEKAKVLFSQDEGSHIRAVFADGTQIDYGDPFAEDFRKLWHCVDCVRNATAPVCTVHTASAHTQLIDMLYRQCSVRNFPAEQVYVNAETDTVTVYGLYERMYQAYRDQTLL